MKINIMLSYLRNCKFRHNIITRTYCTEILREQPKEFVTSTIGDINFIDFHSTWKNDEEEALRKQVLEHMRVIPDFISEAEENSLLAEVEPQLKRMRYEFDHWDNAIQGYRETERGSWSEANSSTLARVRAAAFPPGAALLPHVHVLDLAAAGHIRPHVDAVRFCGDTIAGLCLLSTAVMRLTHEERPHIAFDALLQRRCLYIMSGAARYSFKHAVLGNEDSTWCGRRVQRLRRVAVICREAPPAHAA
ncbi:unnamed protein product [Leptidea sinapis]|uniref:Alpha-ketoglutarate-dependent dioxygenase AlkB-like domain-containing protein n=1 Tax=Leptidea sinapis TaxID=189913 RepID=A0A5E4PQW2_9NEOP|nr:unnamed protein product [Leptidea sinapis]